MRLESEENIWTHHNIKKKIKILWYYDIDHLGYISSWLLDMVFSKDQCKSEHDRLVIKYNNELEIRR